MHCAGFSHELPLNVYANISKSLGDGELLTGAGLVGWRPLGRTLHEGRHEQDGRVKVVG